MALAGKKVVKQILGELPLTAELYWQLRQNGKPLSNSFSLKRTEKWLSIWRTQAESATHRALPGKRVVIFATLRYWIEHAVLMGSAMAGLGNQVTLAYLPYASWRKPITNFDLRRQNAYSHKVLDRAAPILECISLLDIKSNLTLPPSLERAVEEVSIRDVQYTLQIEDVDRENELYTLRLQRNTQVAQTALAWLGKIRPEVVITPNGSILEMGMVYQVARYLNLQVVTYEFGEQRDRIWLAQNAEVMHQETDALWAARKDLPLDQSQWEQVGALFASRQSADLWENFSRRWQGLPSQGGQQVRAQLGLDKVTLEARPVVLLAANVIGDSLTLGRQVFTDSMTEWLQRTVHQFSVRSDVQLIVRIHPGERYTQGPSVADVVRQVLPSLPAHIHLISADDPVNTYDLVEIADLGLAYTTTVGMEMAMSGVPAVIVGQTHYRGKGFTLDPDSWESYFQILEGVLISPEKYRLSQLQVEQAWNYAYRFYFEYPSPFPWHLLHFWNELETWSVERVLSDEGQTIFANTFRYLTGEPADWSFR
jgi:hypothetical protein